MGIFVLWLSANWFAALQTAGIVGGLVFTGYNLRLNARIRKVDTMINLTAQHRAIWLKFLDAPQLKAVLEEDRDTEKEPVTDDEGVFVNLIILHMTTAIVAARSGIFPEFSGQDRDIREFFSLPVPRAVWENTKKFREPGVVRHVDSLLR